MVFLKRKRFIFWLIRAYIKKWGKTIGLSFIAGLAIVLLLFFNRHFLLSRFSFNNHENIGMAGIYAKQDLPNNLPDPILTKLSRGLTKVSDDGRVLPDVADKWEIKDDGKTFIFYIKPNTYYADGKIVDSTNIDYNFEDVTIERPAKSVIVFKLKDKYSPFLVTLANHKIFEKNLTGISDYKISKLKANGGFIESMEIYSKSERKTITYNFYVSQQALKNAYVLGEVSQILDINSPNYMDKGNLANFKNTTLSKRTNYSKIVTVFFNNSDPLLSDKKLRKALDYSLPAKFSEGQVTHTPYGPNFWASKDLDVATKNIDDARTMLKESEASSSSSLKIDLKTLPQYRLLAQEIAKSWEKLGVKTTIEVTDGVPTFYQAFLGELPVLKDPDQYTLWHTAQQNNITNYKNLRIDKLLEDGRRTYDLNQRKTIYLDFQKYLIDDMPAAFLFFPYTYNVTRK